MTNFTGLEPTSLLRSKNFTQKGVRKIDMDIYKFEKKVNEYIASREKLNLKAVYAQLKDTYDLLLTNTFSLENGEEEYREDFEILCGASPAGAFKLYDSGLYIIFDVEKPDGTYVHWHPENIEEAIRDVVAFMQGHCKC